MIHVSLLLIYDMVKYNFKYKKPNLREPKKTIYRKPTLNHNEIIKNIETWSNWLEYSIECYYINLSLNMIFTLRV